MVDTNAGTGEQTGTKVETLDTAKELPTDYRAQRSTHTFGILQSLRLA